MGIEQHPQFPSIVTDDRTYPLSSTANGTIVLKAISNEMRAAGLSQLPMRLGVTESTVIFRFGQPLSSEDQTKLEAVLAAHVGLGNPVDVAKKAKRAAIDARTGGLITSGSFAFQGKQFSMSAISQADTLAIYTLKDDPGLTYPVVRSTKNSDDEVSLADAAAVSAFTMAQKDAVRAIKDAGNALKAQVNAATTVAEVNAVVDNR